MDREHTAPQLRGGKSEGAAPPIRRRAPNGPTAPLEHLIQRLSQTMTYPGQRGPVSTDRALRILRVGIRLNPTSHSAASAPDNARPRQTRPPVLLRPRQHSLTAPRDPCANPSSLKSSISTVTAPACWTPAASLICPAASGREMRGPLGRSAGRSSRPWSSATVALTPPAFAGPSAPRRPHGAPSANDQSAGIPGSASPSSSTPSRAVFTRSRRSRSMLSACSRRAAQRARSSSRS
jgi:hypothetical protein